MSKYTHNFLLKQLLLAVIPILFLLLINVPSVHANSMTFSGTIDTSDPFAGGGCNYYDEHIFTVNVTGDYTIEVTSPSDGIDYDAAAFIGTSNDPFEGPFTANWLTNPLVMTLYVGVIYYLHPMDACELIPFDYTVEITGPGDICADASCNSTPNDDVVYPPDERINWQYGHLNTVIYPHENGVTVYCHDGTNSWLVMLITQDVIDSVNTSQAQSIPILEYNQGECNVAFYILDSGEYQINIWSVEGKLYEIISDTLVFNDPTMRYLDWNE